MLNIMQQTNNKIACPTEALTPASSTSSRYTFGDSAHLIKHMLSIGYEHQGTSVAKVKNKENAGFQKHLMLFSNDALRIDDNNHMQIMVTNSHDGKSSLRINLGIYRTVCANGLVVGDTFTEYRIRHDRPTFLSDVNSAIEKIAACAPDIADKIRHMQNIKLSDETIEALKFDVAHALIDAPIVDLTTMANVKRRGDKENNLYVVFNRLQESLIRGGISIKEEKEVDGVLQFKSRRTRKVTSIDRQREINKELWNRINNFYLEVA